MCGVAGQTVSNWEQGRHYPPANAIAALAEHWDVTADYLVGRTDHPTALPPSFWLVDAELVDRIFATGQLPEDPSEAWAVPVPVRHHLLSSQEYEALRRQLTEAVRPPE